MTGNSPFHSECAVWCPSISLSMSMVPQMHQNTSVTVGEVQEAFGNVYNPWTSDLSCLHAA